MDQLAMLMPVLAQGGGDAAGWLLPAMAAAPIVAGLAMTLPQVKDGASARSLALIVSVGVLVASLLTLGAFSFTDARNPLGFDALFQLERSWEWIGPFGVSFSFGVDTVSLWLIVLTAVLTPLTILGTWDDIAERPKEFYLWLLVLEGALIGVFAATDVILFYVFFELTLVPLFFLIGIFGSGNRRYAAAKFFVFTLTGSLLTLAGVLYVAWHHSQMTGMWTFSMPALLESASAMSGDEQCWVLAALMAGFAVKVPLFPVHTWLPLAHTEAPTAGSVMLAGVLLKLGTYGLYRFALPMAPAAVVEWAPLIAIFAIIGIIYTALICWAQDDIKKLIAYSSVSHMGFCVLGMFALNAEGLGGSIIYMINHGLSTGALFLCFGMVYKRYHTREIDRLSGLGRRLPVWSFFFVFFCLASVGLPGLNGFVGEFLTILGAFKAEGVLGPWYAAAAATGLILGAIYILYMVGKVVMGPLRVPADHDHHVQDLNGREVAALAPIAVLCLVLGLYPTPLLRSFEGSIQQTTAAVRVVLESGAGGATEAVEAIDAAGTGEAAAVVVGDLEGGAAR